MLQVVYQSCVPSTDHGVTIVQDMAQHPYVEAERIARLFDRTRFGSQKRRNSRLKDLHRSYIPEVGLAQHPVAANRQSWPCENDGRGATYQVGDHDLGFTAERCGRCCGHRLGLLALPGVLGNTADRCGSGGRATRGGLAAATATARSGVLASLEDLVQAELHLVGHVAACGGGDT